VSIFRGGLAVAVLAAAGAGIAWGAGAFASHDSASAGQQAPAPATQAVVREQLSATTPVTLNVPQQDGSIQPTTCDSSGVNDWNKTVSGLNSGIDAANNNALEQQAQASTSAAINQGQQQLSSDLSTLENDTNSLNTNKQLGADVNQMKADYGTEQNDYQTEVSQGSCSDGSMDSDEAQVSSDASQVDSDYDQLQDDVQSLQGNDGIGGIQSDMSTVNSDLTALNNLGTTPAVSASAALAGGTKAINSANAAVQWADGQGKAIDAEADQLTTTAGNFESAKGC
jgi:hypothetical protein